VGCMNSAEANLAVEIFSSVKFSTPRCRVRDFLKRVGALDAGSVLLVCSGTRGDTTVGCLLLCPAGGVVGRPLRRRRHSRV